MDASIIKSRLALIRERIRLSAARSGRRSEDVLVVVVSKGQPLDVIQAAEKAGINVFGENYPEEAVKKIRLLNPQTKWHMIGHLQSRKAPLVVTNFHYLHALDSVRLAGKLNRLLADVGRTLPVLLEINIANETSKYGWVSVQGERWQTLKEDISEIAQLPYLKISGLMAMPPYGIHPETVRPYFKQMRSLRDDLAREFPTIHFQELSMGTSSDYEVAVQEGATMVRIGEAILGPRNYIKKDSQG